MGNCIVCGKHNGKNEIDESVCICDNCAAPFLSLFNIMNSRKTKGDLISYHDSVIGQIKTSPKYSNYVKDRLEKAVNAQYENRLHMIESGQVRIEEKSINLNDFQNNSDNRENLIERWGYESRFSTASGRNLPYVVLQVTLKEKLLGTGSGNLEDLEEVINAQVAKGYRLHSMSTANGGSKGFAGGDRIQATLVFERLDIYKAAWGIDDIKQ